MAKKYDVVAVVGEYTNNHGEVKKRYQNVGAILEGNNGPYMLLDRWFNPAGLPNPDNRSNAILSLFEPNEEGFKKAKEAVNQPASGYQGSEDPMADEIPFAPMI